MDLSHTNQKLEALLNIFTDLTLLPSNYTPLLVPCYVSISKDEQLTSVAIQKCKQIFEQWENDDTKATHPDVVRRCMDLWLVIHGEDYNLCKPLPVVPNLFVQETEASDYVKDTQVERLEFDPVTNKIIENPLDNLILEEVEAADFVDLNEFDNKLH